MPSPNGTNGRDELGRFANGNAGGPGNPHAASVARFRRVLLEAVTDADMLEVVGVLVERAKAGDRWAVCELLDRCCGKARSMPDDDDGDGEPVSYTVVIPDARPRVDR